MLYGDEDPETIIGQVIEVPDDFRVDFENDLDGSIRDIAGISTLTVDQYIRNFSKVMSAVERSEEDPHRRHPYTTEVTNFEDGHKLYRKVYLTTDPQTNNPKLRYGDGKPRVVHIDLSQGKQDATGLAVGHITDMVKVQRRMPDGRIQEEYAPEIFYDLMLRIEAPKDGEIFFPNVRDVIYALIEDGMDIQLVTMDTWQSVETQQQLRKKGIAAEPLSIDKTTDPYDFLKQAFYEDRVNMYRYEPAMQELRRLEHDRVKNKIDHPMGGSKDVSDAMAGVAYTLTRFSGRLFRPKADVQVF
jgi:hypothetical protein